MANSTERRASERVRCSLGVSVVLPDGPLAAELMNISQRGLFLRAGLTTPKDQLRLASTLRTGTQVRFSLHHADIPGVCTGAGRVAWMSDLGVGIDFSLLNAGLREFIQLLLDGDASHILSVVVTTPTVTLVDVT